MKLRLPILAGCAVVLAVAGVVLAAPRLQEHAPGPIENAKVITYSVDKPAESSVPDKYSVAGKQPLSIAIPAAGIKGFIQKVGIDQHNALAAPNNVNLAGWFVQSVLPGRKGLSIIDGHVDGVSQRGIFHNLAKVAKGDKVTVTYGDNSVRSFTVFETRSVRTEQANGYLYDQDPKVPSQLNIITCAGTYQQAAQAYDQRVIVSAKLD